MQSFDRVKHYFKRQEYLNRMAIAFARASATAPLRVIDPSTPRTWEFAGFSQNEEDGITDYLVSRIKHKNRYFIEIGSADGLENNTAWLAFGKKYTGLMIEGSIKAEWSNRFLRSFNLGIQHLQMFITQENASEILVLAKHRDPDFFSLDIDGTDFYILRKLFELGLRPKVVCVEYNSAFGPDRSVTIPYQADFSRKKKGGHLLYYGVSIAAWHKFFKQYGYRFVAIESNGVNVFFVNPAEVPLPDPLNGPLFLNNFVQYAQYGDWREQFEPIKDRAFVTV